VAKAGGLGGAEPDQSLTISWALSQLTDIVRGNLTMLRSSAGNFTGTVQSCILDDTTTSSIADTSTLAAGGGVYFLARGGGACNLVGRTFSAGAPREAAGRDEEIGADPSRCP